MAEPGRALAFAAVYVEGHDFFYRLQRNEFTHKGKFLLINCNMFFLGLKRCLYLEIHPGLDLSSSFGIITLKINLIEHIY
jgi:hypothetical protein